MARELADEVLTEMPESPLRKRNRLLEACAARPDLFRVDIERNNVCLVEPPKPLAAATDDPVKGEAPDERSVALDEISQVIEQWASGKVMERSSDGKVSYRSLVHQLRLLRKYVDGIKESIDSVSGQLAAVLGVVVDAVQGLSPPDQEVVGLAVSTIEAALELGLGGLEPTLNKARKCWETAKEAEMVNQMVTESIAQIKTLIKTVPTIQQLHDPVILTQMGGLCQLQPVGHQASVGVEVVNFIIEYIQQLIEWRPEAVVQACCLELVEALKNSEWLRVVPDTRRRAVNRMVKHLKSMPPPDQPVKGLASDAQEVLTLEQQFVLEAAGEALLREVDQGDGWLPEHDDLMKQMENVLRKRVRGCHFALFGSAASGFGLKLSDLDVCLVAPDLDPPDENSEAIKKMLRRLANMFAHLGVKMKSLILRAKVPIAKLEGMYQGVCSHQMRPGVRIGCRFRSQWTSV